METTSELLKSVEQLTQDVSSIHELVRNPNLKKEPQNLRHLQLLLRVCEPVPEQLGKTFGELKQQFFCAPVVSQQQQPQPQQLQPQPAAKKVSKKRKRSAEEKQKCTAALSLSKNDLEKIFFHNLKSTPANLFTLESDAFEKLLQKKKISAKQSVGSGECAFNIDFVHCAQKGRAFKSKPRGISLRAIFPLITCLKTNAKAYEAVANGPYESPDVRTPVARAFFSRATKIDDHINYTNLSRILDKFPDKEHQHGGFSTCNTNKHMSGGVQNDVSIACGTWFMRCLAGGDCALVAMAACDADDAEWEILRRVSIVCPHGEDCVFIKALRKCDGFDAKCTFDAFDYDAHFHRLFSTAEEIDIGGITTSSSSSSSDSSSTTSSDSESDEQGRFIASK